YLIKELFAFSYFAIAIRDGKSNQVFVSPTLF
ncbi:MAG: hypothetical protein ACJAQ4_001914, partial [Cryomorphaceae bacterium]